MHKLYELALTFHALADCPTGETFDAGGFAKWAVRRNMGNGGTWAALFILSVWNDRTDWSAEPGVGLQAPRRNPSLQGRFYMHDALGVWDREHQAAFHAWTARPWWC